MGTSSKFQGCGVRIVAQWKQIQVVSMRMLVWSLASLSALGIWHCWKLLCVTDVAQIPHGCGCDVGLQLQLQFSPSLGTSICCGYNPKKKKKKKKKIPRLWEQMKWYDIKCLAWGLTLKFCYCSLLFSELEEWSGEQHCQQCTGWEGFGVR